MGWREWLDGFAYYETPKYALIRDIKLAVLHYIMLTLIIGYIIGAVIFSHRYMLLEQPTGSIRFSFQTPQTRNLSVAPIQDYAYCHSEECVLLDETLIVYPVPTDNSIVIATQITNTTKYFDTILHKYMPVDNAPGNTFFIANIENCTLLVDHSMSTSFMNTNSLGLDGYFGDTRHIAPNQYDIFTVAELLDAAGIQLDAISGADPSHARTHRQTGVVLLVNIEYSNTHSFNSHHLIYTYRVSAVENTKYRVEQAVYTKSYDRIVSLSRRGVHIIFQITGTIGKLDFQTFVINVASSISLITLATIITNFIFIRHCGRCKERYRDEIYENLNPTSHLEEQFSEHDVVRLLTADNERDILDK
jgi:hypothetical protein